MTERKLTPKQIAFAEHYIASGNATDAARKAGYKQPNIQGPQNLVKLSISNYIAKHMKQLSAERIADAEEVLQYLSAVMRGEEKEKDYEWNEEKRKMEEIERDLKPRDRLKAAELLGKRHALFTDRVSMDARVNNSVLDEIAAQLGYESSEADGDSS